MHFALNHASWRMVFLSTPLLLSSCLRQEVFEDSGIAAALRPDKAFFAAANGGALHLSNGSATYGGGVYRVELQKVATVELNEEEAAFMNALRREVENLVRAKGGTIEGEGRATSKRELTGFQVDYRWGRNQGIIRVHSFRESHRIKIHLLCYEHLRGITIPPEGRKGRWSWVWKAAERP